MLDLQFLPRRHPRWMATASQHLPPHSWLSWPAAALLICLSIASAAPSATASGHAPVQQTSTAPPVATPAAKPAQAPASTTNSAPYPSSGSSRRSPQMDANTAVNSSPSLNGAETTTSIPLKITLTPSEIPLKLGATSNMAVMIQNVSNHAVWINLASLELTTSAMVAGNPSKCVSMIPAAINANFYQQTSPGSMQASVTLQPQDEVSALFNLSQSAVYSRPVTAPGATQAAQLQAEKQFQAAQRSCSMGPMAPIKRMLDFSPGNYEYYLTGLFSLCTYPNNNAENPQCNLPPRTFAASASFPVGIDQITILLFAVIGGWLALLYVIFTEASQPGSILHDFNASLIAIPPDDKGGNPVTRFFQRLTTSMGARAVGRFLVRVVAVAILSASFTIVSSRLADTQLPVKISILDAWGAMTIGFLSYFIGSKFIASITNWGTNPPQPSTTPPPEAPARQDP